MSKKTGPKISAVERLAPYRMDIAQRFNFAMAPSGECHWFDGTTYVAGAEDMAANYMLRHMNASTDDQAHWSPQASAYIREFVKIVAGQRPLWGALPLGSIPILNGVVQYGGKTPVLQTPHRPDFLSAIKLPVNYDPTADCPAIRAFQKLVLPDGPDDFIAEVAAWCMMPINARQKALMLVGPGGTGKSTFLSIIQHFLGKANIAMDSLHALIDNRFALAQIWGKIAIVCPDMEKDELPSMGIFKQLVGDDNVTAEYKYKNRFFFRPTGKCIFSCNGTPRAKGADGAFWRRWHLVPFETNLLGKDRRKMDDVMAELTTPTEMSGLLNWALSVIGRVLDHGVTETERHRMMVQVAQKLESDTERWMQAELVFEDTLSLSLDELFSSYHAWSRRFGGRPVNPTDLARALESKKLAHDGHKFSGVGLRAKIEGADGDIHIPVPIPMVH